MERAARERRVDEMAALAGGLPALIVMWAFIVLVFLTNPVRPYATGGFLVVDLLVLVVIGAVIALRRSLPTALVAACAGLAVAVAVQLYVLASGATFTAEAIARLPEPPWSTQVGIALLLGLVALVGGSSLSSLARRGLARRSAARTPGASIPTAPAAVASMSRSSRQARSSPLRPDRPTCHRPISRRYESSSKVDVSPTRHRRRCPWGARTSSSNATETRPTSSASPVRFRRVSAPS
jgi:hypothetical protein